MGLWSRNCSADGCGAPALSPAATNVVNAWMARVVAIARSPSSVHVGIYDGYGRVAGADDVLAPDDVTVYHQACWELLGRPMEYAGPSEWAADQGWFFPEGTYDRPDPRRGVTSVRENPMAQVISAEPASVTSHTVPDVGPSTSTPTVRPAPSVDDVTHDELVAQLVRYRDLLVESGHPRDDEPEWLRRVPVRMT